MPDSDEQKAIEEEFVASWDWIENVYKSQNTYIAQWVGSFPDLISELRKRNYDYQLRAGTQLLNFILSRAKKDGLRAGQAHLQFQGKKEGGMRVSYYEASTIISELEVASVEITPEIDVLLKRLLAQPID